MVVYLKFIFYYFLLIQSYKQHFQTLMMAISILCDIYHILNRYKSIFKIDAEILTYHLKELPSMFHLSLHPFILATCVI